MIFHFQGVTRTRTSRNKAFFALWTAFPFLKRPKHFTHQLLTIIININNIVQQYTILHKMMLMNTLCSLEDCSVNVMVC